MPTLDSRVPMLPHRRLFGNLLELRENRLDVLLACQRLGNVSGFHVGPRPVMVVAEPAIIQEVLVDRSYEFHKGINYRFLAKMLGNGLVTSEDEVHKRQRRLIAPLMTPKRIAGYAETMSSLAEARAAAWPDEGELDLAEEMSKLTLDVVATTIFRTSVASDAEIIIKGSTEGMRWTMDEAMRLVHLPLATPLPRMWRMRRSQARIHAVIARLIAERRASGDAGGDILSMLLSAKDEVDGRGMSDQQIRDEAMTMIFAGHETTANGLAWTFYLLSQHPDVRAAVVGEVEAALGGRSPTLADLPRMPLALRVFKESMRLFPPVPMIARRATKPMEVAGYRLPKDQVVVVNIYGLHRRADFYPDPERFDPSRFTPENEKKLPRHAYLPFATGPRVCIGNHFALMEAHLLLAALLQRFELDLAPGARVVPEPLVTLKPKFGIRMRVRRRNRVSPGRLRSSGS